MAHSSKPRYTPREIYEGVLGFIGMFTAPAIPKILDLGSKDQQVDAYLIIMGILVLLFFIFQLAPDPPKDDPTQKPEQVFFDAARSSIREKHDYNEEVITARIKHLCDQITKVLLHENASIGEMYIALKLKTDWILKFSMLKARDNTYEAVRMIPSSESSDLTGCFSYEP